MIPRHTLLNLPLLHSGITLPLRPGQLGSWGCLVPSATSAVGGMRKGCAEEGISGRTMPGPCGFCAYLLAICLQDPVYPHETRAPLSLDRSFCNKDPCIVHPPSTAGPCTGSSLTRACPASAGASCAPRTPSTPPSCACVCVWVHQGMCSAQPRASTQCAGAPLSLSHSHH